MPAEPLNDAAKQKIEMTAKAQELFAKVDETYTELSNVKNSLAKANEQMAKMEALAKPEVQAVILAYVEAEENLKDLIKHKNGEGSVLDRIGELEAHVQRAEKHVDDSRAREFDPRAEA